MALSEMGEVGRVSGEFKKSNRGLSISSWIGLVLWGGATGSLLIYILNRMFAEKMTLLLAAHIFSLTAGYGAVLVAGGLSLTWGLGRRFDLFSTARQQEMLRTLTFFNRLAVGLVVPGFVLGAVWTQHAWGVFWINDPRAVGGLVAMVWLMSVWVIQQLRRSSEWEIIVSNALNNIVIALAWFGPHVGYRIFALWPVDIFVGVYLVGGVAGVIHLREWRKRKVV